MTLEELTMKVDKTIDKLCANPWISEDERVQLHKELIVAFGHEIIYRTLKWGNTITPESLTQPVIFIHFISPSYRHRAISVWAEAFAGIADENLAKHMWRDILELDRRGLPTDDILLWIGCDPRCMDKNHAYVAAKALKLLLKRTPAPKQGKLSKDEIPNLEKRLFG